MNVMTNPEANATRQFVNACAPTNFAATNPVAVNTAIKTRGQSLLNGLRNVTDDLVRGRGRLSLKMSDHAAFRFGDNIAKKP